MAERGLTLTCPASILGGPLAPLHTCNGVDPSPALQSCHTPRETSSFILLMEDADAPNGPVTHWVLFDIPGSAAGLAAQETSIGIPGRNDLHHEGYTGPCPPPRGSEHRYVLRLYALDMASLGLPRGAPRREVENAMRGHVLEQAELMGRYGGR